MIWKDQSILAQQKPPPWGETNWMVDGRMVTVKLKNVEPAAETQTYLCYWNETVSVSGWRCWCSGWADWLTVSIINDENKNRVRRWYNEKIWISIVPSSAWKNSSQTKCETESRLIFTEMESSLALYSILHWSTLRQVIYSPAALVTAEDYREVKYRRWRNGK